MDDDDSKAFFLGDGWRIITLSLPFFNPWVGDGWNYHLKPSRLKNAMGCLGVGCLGGSYQVDPRCQKLTSCLSPHEEMVKPMLETDDGGNVSILLLLLLLLTAEIPFPTTWDIYIYIFV